jgi:hypothetical protein
MIHDRLMTEAAAAMARMKRGVQHPVPVRVYYWSEGRFETIEAVNFAAAQELVEKINRKKSAGRHAYIPAVGESYDPAQQTDHPSHTVGLA